MKIELKKTIVLNKINTMQTTIEGEKTENAKAKNYSKPKPEKTKQDELKEAFREAANKRLLDEKQGKKPKEKKLDLF
jgi:hypothetical protein